MASVIKPTPRLVTLKNRVEVEESLQQLSKYLDGLFKIPVVGWRFGLDVLIGFVPGVGDWATAVVSFYLLTAAVRYKVPKITILRMAFNIVIDFLLGAVPFIGDILDALWKSNKKNLQLLTERAQVQPGEAKRGNFSDWLFVGVIMAVLLGVLLASLTVAGYLLYYVFKTTPLF